jgi:hypothetical protein
MKPWLLRAIMVMVLGLAFLAYLRPDFMLDIGNRIVMCF